MDAKYLQRLKQLGVNVRAARKAKGFTQQDLATMCGQEKSLIIQRIEKGDFAGGLFFLYKVADALGTTASDLLVEPF
ncbi:MAG: helix-turn-helix transcriptional regulator [Sphingobacteriales bacterium JAD_PAG50586_3]|nr:MAG: helix-turn-helix transcriptional regulator [Sphingobacteriales bacterium JAD_PAG50586_3]